MMNSLSLGYQSQFYSGGQQPSVMSSTQFNGAPTTNDASFVTWNNFFLTAGIPANAANEYAIIFSQHRIKIDMLRDITKEILGDMGIKAMGDIISILRHAKEICTRNEINLGLSQPVSMTNHGKQQTITSSQTRTLTSPHNASQREPQLVSTKATRSINRASIPSTSSTGANKIQSRLSMNSGALVTANLRQQHHQVSQITERDLRSIAGLSQSVSDRLKPAPVTTDPKYTEKTLTVIMPKGVHSLHKNRSRQQHLSKSLGSRLSSSPMKSTNNNQSTLLTASAKRSMAQHSDLRTSLKSSTSSHKSDISSSSSNLHKKGTTTDKRDHRSYHAKSKSKSAVFSRLR